MNVPTITVPREQAREKLRAYRRDRHADAEAEYRALEETYAALADGAVLIDVHQAIRNGGFDEKMRPRLAIARADRKEIEFRWNFGSVATFDGNNARARRTSAALSIQIDFQRRHELQHWIRAYAMVPMVPADVRPATGQLKDWHILWEVDQWHEKPVTTPPRDPYLLRHLRGPLYAVIAEWDLTDLERAIMQEFRTANR